MHVRDVEAADASHSEKTTLFPSRGNASNSSFYGKNFHNVSFIDGQDEEEKRRSQLIRKRESQSISLTEALELSDSGLKKIAYFLPVYGAMGVVAFSVVFDKWSVVDSLYFSAVTFSTVGFGDLHPKNDAGRVFCIAYSIVGITALGIVFGEIGKLFLEKQKNALNDATSNFLNFLNEDQENDCVDMVGEETLEEEESFLRMLGCQLVSQTPSVLLILSLSCVIGYFEGWTSVQIVYFATVTATTTGYGDITPEKKSMKVLSLVFIPLSVCLTGAVLGSIAESIIGFHVRKKEKNLFQRSFKIGDLYAMDMNCDGKVSRGEFLAYMLVSMDKVDKETIDNIFALFDKFDVKGDDYITQLDVEALQVRKQLKRAKSASNRSLSVTSWVR